MVESAGPADYPLLQLTGRQTDRLCGHCGEMTRRRLPLLLLLLLLGCLAAPARAGSVIAPPWVDAERNPCSAQSWQLVQWPGDGRCHAIFQRGPCAPSEELVWDAAAGRAVCACPAGHLLHRQTARCYRRHARGPCPRRHFFADGGPRGEPTCHAFRECAPGEIFWPADGRCHARLTRGPCARGELLALNRLTLEPECGCSRGHMARSYWARTDSCYQEYTRGPCPHGLLFVFNASRQTVECSCHAQMHEHYDARTGQCYPQGERGPCPPGNLFVFNAATRQTACECAPGGLLEPGTGACHRGYTQGPCAAGQFVSPAAGAPQQGVCTPNRCRRGELQFPADGGCHRVGARGPCPAGQLVRYEAVRGVSYRGVCGCSDDPRWPPAGRCRQEPQRASCSTLECRCRRRRRSVAASGGCGGLLRLQDSLPPPPPPPPPPVSPCPAGTTPDRRRGTCRPSRPTGFDSLELLRITR